MTVALRSALITSMLAASLAASAAAETEPPAWFAGLAAAESGARRHGRLDLTEQSSPAASWIEQAGAGWTPEDELIDSLRLDGPPLADVAVRPVSPDELPQYSDHFWSRFSGCTAEQGCPWTIHCLPDGLLYRSYLAGEKEPRFGSGWLYDQSGSRMIWEIALGGRVGVVRYGTPGAVRPQGWQLDLEGAALPRLDMDHQEDLEAVDFRFGVPITWRRGPTAVKFGYYHISAHVGDEFLDRNPGFTRVNYVRESLLLGITHDVTDAVRVYGEVGYAFGTSGGAEPWEFQFGAEYSPAACDDPAGPFAAFNVHLREEFDFGGSVNVLAGWQWRGLESGRLFRIGGQYYNGKSIQYSFFREHEELVGLGMWFDY